MYEPIRTNHIATDARSRPSIDIPQPEHGGKSGVSSHHYSQAYQEGGFRNTIDALRRYGANPDLAEEISQAAWVRGWERLDQLRNPAGLVRWINEIAINLHRDEGRKTRRLTAMFPAGLDFQVPADVRLSVIDLRLAFANCSAEQRAFLDAYLNDLTTTEIAARLNISVGAVHHRLSRLRASLRRRLSTH